jgi:hypothetical protein
MEIKELVKYIDFLQAENSNIEGLEDFAGYKLATVAFDEDNLTYMVGHQPRNLTPEEIQERLEKQPNVHSSIDADDKYWTDDILEPFVIDYSKLEFLEGDLYKAKIQIGDKEFEIVVENDCGFAVGYGSIDIYNYIQENL